MADNPIKYSDFIKPDDSVSNLIAQLEELQTKYTAMLKSIKAEALEMEKAVKKANSATEDGKKATDAAAIEAEKLIKEQEKLTQAQSDTGKQIAKLRAETQKQNQITKLQTKLNDSLDGSYDKLSAQYSLNKIALNAMSEAERKGTKAGKDLEKQTNEIYQEMKALQEATGKHVLSVGDYEKGWKNLTTQLGEVPGATGDVVGGFQNMGAAAKKFMANPIVLTIALIVGGLYALFSIFKKTKAGSDLLAKGTAALSGIMSAITGVVDKLYKGLLAVFEDPQQAMADFWEALKKNIVNRLQGVVLLVKSLGMAFKALFERDINGLKNAAKDAGSALIQMTSGLDAEQQKNFANAVKETTKEIYEQAKAFAALEEARRNTRRANRELEKSVENLITQEETYKAIADDATKSFQEREAAAQKASELTVKRAKLQQAIASSNLAIINKEIDLRKKNGEDVEDLLDQQLDAYKTLKGAQRDYLLSVRDNEKRASELVQDRLEKDLDILIDGFDNQKTINEKIIADDNRTFEERQAKLAETRALFESTFAKQIETIQKFTGVQIDSNALISESDAVLLNQKIRALGLSEIIEGRLLEVVRERRTMTQDLADAEKDLNNKRDAAEQKRIADEKAANKQRFDSSMNAIDQEMELKMSEIDIMRTTEAEKTRLRLEAEKERLKKILDLNLKAGGELSKAQIETIKNLIGKIDQEIAKNKNQSQDIYSVLGIKLDDEQKQAIQESINYVISGIQSILAARVAAADAALQKVQEEGSAIQTRYDQEIEARNNGYANNVIQVQKELELNRKKEQQALKDKEKAQKAQEAIDTLIQTSGLVTAAVQIYKSLAGIPIVGPFLAKAAVGVMFATYAVSKIKAKSLAKEKYGEGGLEILKGGSHSSGNDIPIGMTDSGKQRTAEGGEALAIINKKNTAKYRSVIPGIVKSLNQGTFEKSFGNALVQESAQSFSPIFESSNLSTIERDLSEIRKRGEIQRYTDSNGRLVEVYKNVKTVYV
jgi:DNA repair exonuclease SbcCD ATPase subunit